MADSSKALFLLDTTSLPWGIREIYPDPNIVTYVMSQFGPLIGGSGLGPYSV